MRKVLILLFGILVMILGIAVCQDQILHGSKFSGARVQGTPSIATMLSYSSPYCIPNASAPHNYASGTAIGAAWACGDYPTTVPPSLPTAGCPASTGDANTCTAGYSATTAGLVDPDTGNRILRVTMDGSLNNTGSGHQWYTQNSGWIKIWNSDSTKFWFFGDGRMDWVGWEPSTMTLSGQSGRMPVIAPGTFNFDPSNPSVFYGLSGATIQKYTIASNGSMSGATALINLNTISGWISGQAWQAIYMGGNTIASYSGTSGQGTGRLIATYNVVTTETHMLDVGATQATFDGSVISNIDVGSLNALHSIVVGQDGRYLFVDTGLTAGQTCNTSTAPHNAQFMIDLQTGTAKQMSPKCDQTHLAVGFDGDVRQSAGYFFNQGCANDSRGLTYRTFLGDFSAGAYISGCYSGSNNPSTHVSWANNSGTAKNQAPVFLHQWNSGTGVQCIGCNELDAVASTSTQGSAQVWRFGQTWASVGSNGCGDAIARSSTISPNGKYALFASDWLGNTGGSGPCPGGRRRDIFIMELK